TSRSQTNLNFPNGRYLPDGTLNIAGRWKSPGPGKYFLHSCTGFKDHDFTLERRPAYTIARRLNDSSKEQKSPGPIYLPSSEITIKGRVKIPSCYITSRPQNNNSSDTPGPQKYAPEKYYYSGPKITIGSKHKHLDIPVHPVGPNAYNLPNTIGNTNVKSNIKTAPKVSLSGRNNFMSITYGMEKSPTTLYYPSLNQVKTSPPRWTLTGRHYLPEMDKNTPGPNRYKSEAVNLRSAPAITMGIRHSEFCSTGFPIKDDHE
ncbi:unnamed protein product, partial [Brachionus calyciflorus]